MSLSAGQVQSSRELLSSENGKRLPGSSGQNLKGNQLTHLIVFKDDNTSSEMKLHLMAPKDDKPEAVRVAAHC